jgi:hypothetical protein
MFSRIGKALLFLALMLFVVGILGISGSGGSELGSLTWLMAFPVLLLAFMSFGIAASKRSREDGHYAMLKADQEAQNTESISALKILVKNNVISDVEAKALEKRLL